MSKGQVDGAAKFDRMAHPLVDCITHPVDGLMVLAVGGPKSAAWAIILSEGLTSW
jgi:hypothetical protein